MELDEDLCVCFHVSKRKVLNFLRVQRPTAGRAIGRLLWGRDRLWLVPTVPAGDVSRGAGRVRPSLPRCPATEDYLTQREAYLRAGRGTPPSTAPAAGEVGETPTGD